MNRYKSYYETGCTSSQIEEILHTLESKESSDWEDYIWGVKCLVENGDEINPNIITESVNMAFRLGLTSRTDYNLYLDGTRILYVFYSEFGKYELVVNQALSLLDNDDNAPDWAYHNLAAAEIHTKEISRIITDPSIFLSDIDHNDGTDPNVRLKQAGIFRDFLCIATEYLEKNETTSININPFLEAASKYGLDNSKEWSRFKHIVLSREKGHSYDESNSKYYESELQNAKEAIAQLEQQLEETKDTIRSLEKGSQKSNSVINTLQDQLEKNKATIEQLQISVKNGHDDNLELRAELDRVYVENERVVYLLNAEKQKNEELNETINNSEKDVEVKNQLSLQDALGYVFSFMNFSAAQSAYNFLSERLPKISKSWWNDCVAPAVSPDQLMTLNKKGSNLEACDLIILTRIIRENWEKFSGFDRGLERKRCITAMYEYRNKISHFSQKDQEYTADLVIEGLETIYNFIAVIDPCSAELEKIEDLKQEICDTFP